MKNSVPPLATSFQKRLWMRNPGLGLMEVLVAVAILGLLIAVIVPSVNSLGNRALGAKCLNNLRQLYGVLRNYASDYEGFIPLASDYTANKKSWVKSLADANYLITPAFTDTPQKYIAYCPGSSRNHPMAYQHLGNYGINRAIAGENNELGEVVRPRVPMHAINDPSKKLLIADSGGNMIWASMRDRPSSPVAYLPGYPTNSQVAWPESLKKDAIEGRHGGKINVVNASGNAESLSSIDLADSGRWQP